ncbi:DUF4363 family protein [Salinibacillus xinjiangensis]|uniref:DUF4363 family protein n=1 Tax=Salinibacillus xinjiangensis TaxID=1229268 RepID=A0A6G1X600_9BACI|nr:DUF4363 family protein [Salinibacillus xinjiangensis]MRG86310.1 DUF4363 family protein [Salinibacillus xinjiangensis]
MKGLLNMLRHIVFAVLLITILAGCAANEEAKNKIEDKLEQVEAATKISDWTQAEENVKSAKKEYQKELWKMQLLGDQTSYDNLKLAIDQLKAAVKTQNKNEISSQIAKSKSYLSEIFN